MADNRLSGKPDDASGFTDYSGSELLMLAEEYITECRNGGTPDDSDDAAAKSSTGGDCEMTESKKRCPDANQSRVSAKRPKSAKKSGDSTRFPNIAGFCRYLGIGTRQYAELEKRFPIETGRIAAAFEDEALNSDIAATLLGAYLKLRLGYDSPSEQKKDDKKTGEICVIFEHDILSDGE